MTSTVDVHSSNIKEPEIAHSFTDRFGSKRKLLAQSERTNDTSASVLRRSLVNKPRYHSNFHTGKSLHSKLEQTAGFCFNKKRKRKMFAETQQYIVFLRSLPH